MIVFGLLAVAFIFIFQIQPLYSVLTDIKMPALPKLEGNPLEGFVGGILDYVNKNPLSVIVGSVSVGTAVYGILKARAESKAKQVATQAAYEAQLAQSSIAKQYTQLSNQRDQLQLQFNELKANTNDAALQEAQNLVSQKEATIGQMRYTIDDLHGEISRLNAKLAEYEKPKPTVP